MAATEARQRIPELHLQLGQVVFTPAAMELLERCPFPFRVLLGMHATGEWGDVDDEDWESNNWSALNGERILSSYEVLPGETLWIITEWDRSQTTLLLPADY